MRQLGLGSATALVVANMIGAGVFTTTGFLLADLKSPTLVIVAWLIGAVLALSGALCYGAMARAMPESGGEYLYLSKTIHPAAGFLAGWVSLLAGFSAPLAAVAIGFGEYTKIWLPGWNPKWIGSLLLIACAGMHLRSAILGARIQNGIVILKVVALMGFIAFGMAQWAGSDVAPPPVVALPDPTAGFPWSAFAISLVWISFSYAGWNAAAYIGSEVINPERNLPRSLMFGTLIVALLYVGANAVFVFSAPPALIAGQLEVAQIAAKEIGGSTWEQGVTLVIAVALVTSASAMMMAGPRVYHRMALDGLLPRGCRDGELIKEGQCPRRAIILQWGVAMAFLWTGAFQQLLTYIGFTLSVSNVAVVLGLLFHFKRRRLPLQIAGGLIAPTIFVVFTLFAIGFGFQRQPWECALGAATLVLGLVLYAILLAPQRKVT